MGEIPVTYHAREGRTFKGAINLDERGLGMLFGRKRSGSYAPEQVRRISFDDPGRTKANGAALVMFGVLGLVARRAFTIVTVSVVEQDMYFESDFPVGTWRASAPRMLEDVPWLVGKLIIDGAVVGGPIQTPEQSQTSPIDRLRQLAELRDAGIVSPAEFEAKKAELLGRM